MLERIFRSKAEVAVLKIVLFTDGLHLREIARRGGVSAPEAKKELDALVALGVLNSEKRGNQVIFHANKDCGILEDLRNLFTKTENLLSMIKEKLQMMEGIRYCLVFGSAAAGRMAEKSDIDLLVIGDVSEEYIESAIFQLQKETKREINFILWNENDFHKKLKQKSTFLNNILKKKHLWIMGDENEFIRFVKKAYD